MFDISAIRGVNVLSWKSLDLRIPQGQTLGIQGSNRSGKSNIIDVIFLVLFNKTLRSHKKPTIIYDGAKSWSAEVDFSEGSRKYTVIRGSKKCAFREEGVPDVVGATAVNERMMEVLKCSMAQFTNISYLGQNRAKSLASSTPSDRRKVIGPFIDLPDFKSLGDAVRSDTRKTDRSLVLYEERVTSLSQRIDQATRETSKKLIDLKKEQDDTQALMAPSKKKRGELARRIGQFEVKEDAVESEVSDLVLGIQEQELLKSQYSGVLKSLGSSRGRCPSCFSTPTESSRKEASSFMEGSVKASMEKLSSLSVCVHERRETLGKVRKVLKDLREKMVTVGRAFNEAMNHLKGLKEAISSLELEDSSQDLKPQLALAQKGLNLAQVESLRLQFWSSALGSQGLPSFFLRGVVGDLSARVTTYLNDILPGMVCRFYYDQDIKCEIVDEGSVRDFEACSGAERRLIDLATSFALRDIAMARNGDVPSFILLDEIFDTLDDEHLQVVQAWLAKLKGCTILLITHNAGLKDWLPHVKEVSRTSERGSFFV